MIASLDGTVGAIAADSVVIEVGGIGYRVFAAPSLLATLTPGERARVHTFHVVREDMQALYGFGTAQELGFFGLLLSVNGVGPRVALAIVGSRPIADLQLAILTDDQAVLLGVTGVGKRLAARICLELKEKVEAAGLAAVDLVGGRRGVGGEGEVVAALQALGYTLQEARSAARATAGAATVDDSLEERVKSALRSFGQA